MKAPAYIADFDSASAMVRAIGRSLVHEDMRALGTSAALLTPLLRPASHVLDRTPAWFRDQLYIWNGFRDAIAARKLSCVDGEEISRWVTECYPSREYPAVAIGSSNGALSHLWAALGIPWLPQTFLVPVRRSGVHPDDPLGDMAWGRRHADALLKANPDLQLHHMNDANQDRLMIRRMTYFRVKRRTLGKTYERFLRDHLAPGGTIIVSECGISWPTRQLGERHVFQHGALGGATEEEYAQGSPRVARYLQRYGSPRIRWESPGTDGRSPEAEWGFEPCLRTDIERFARRHGYRVRRVRYPLPEDPSPFVADLYRWWLSQRGIEPSRLFVSSFALLDPYWTLRSGSAPFWMVFNTRPSLERLTAYLETATPFDEIFLALFSHGVQSVGLPTINEWESAIDRARHRAVLLGVDRRTWPKDFGNFGRATLDFRDTCKSRVPMPLPLQLQQLDRFIEQAGGRYDVQWIESDADAASRDLESQPSKEGG